MKEKLITFSQVHPFLRYVRELVKPFGTHFLGSLAKAYDCRLFYVRHGIWLVTVEGKNYYVERGDLVIFGPATEYMLCPEIQTRPELLAVNFDYVYDSASLSQSVPPATLDYFQEENVISPVKFTDTEQFNQPIHLRNMESIEPTLLEIKEEYETHRKYYQQHISGLFMTVLTSVARAISFNHTGQYKSAQITDSIISYIHENYAQPITNEKLSSVFHFHPNYINRLMVRYTGLSTYQYVLMRRITQAIKLIQTTDLPITQIASKVGFHDPKHFSKIFKSKTGKSPRNFRIV